MGYSIYVIYIGTYLVWRPKVIDNLLIEEINKRYSPIEEINKRYNTSNRGNQ